METTQRTRGAKYMEGYLEFKEGSKWVNYWVVIRGFRLYFFKDSNTNVKENIQGHLDLSENSRGSCGKNSKGKFEFELKADRGKKYLFRANSEPDRLQWVYTVGLAAQGKVPDCEPEADKPSTNSKEPASKKVSNPYSEVPNFNISPDDAAIIDEEMQKRVVNLNKKHNSFSSHCKNIFKRKEKRNNESFDSEETSSRPESEGAEASPEALYDDFPDEKPSYYFGKISREDSEKILQNHPPGSYLVRDSESVLKPGAYTISLRHREKFRHHKIETMHDGGLVIKTHEDKVFPNLTLLMKYFAESQKRDIDMHPVICEERDTVNKAEEPVSQESYEQMGPRPPVPGCEVRPTPESSSGHTSPREPTIKHSYENLPDKQKQKVRPPLRSRVTSPDLHSVHGYENLPDKEKIAAHRVSSPSGYVQTSARDAPGLPPRSTQSHAHGYENIPDKGQKPLPPRQPKNEGYVNLPPKASSGAPELPPRKPSQTHAGYENIPSRDDSSLRGRTLPPYQNLPPSVPSRSATQGRGRTPPQFNRSATVPAHILQNTLGQMEKGS